MSLVFFHEKEDISCIQCIRVSCKPFKSILIYCLSFILTWEKCIFKADKIYQKKPKTKTYAGGVCGTHTCQLLLLNSSMIDIYRFLTGFTPVLGCYTKFLLSSKVFLGNGYFLPSNHWKCIVWKNHSIFPVTNFQRKLRNMLWNTPSMKYQANKYLFQQVKHRIRH